jgi:hypothetical protein
MAARISSSWRSWQWRVAANKQWRRRGEESRVGERGSGGNICRRGYPW